MAGGRARGEMALWESSRGDPGTPDRCKNPVLIVFAQPLAQLLFVGLVTRGMFTVGRQDFLHGEQQLFRAAGWTKFVCTSKVGVSARGAVLVVPCTVTSPRRVSWLPNRFAFEPVYATSRNEFYQYKCEISQSHARARTQTYMHDVYARARTHTHTHTHIYTHIRTYKLETFRDCLLQNILNMPGGKGEISR